VRPYVAVGAALAALMLGQTINRLWSTPDFWLYSAAVKEFASRPLHPLHPILAGGGADPYMNPYTFVLGIVSRESGLDTVDVLAVAGMCNLAALLTGIWVFTRAVSSKPLAPTLVLVFTLTAWGWAPWRWSGYFNLNSIGSGLPLGSTFASALGLFVLAVFIRWLQTGRWQQLAFVAAGYSVVLLSHQLTGLWVGLVGLGFAVGQPHRWTFPSVRNLVLALGIMATLLLSWPFYSIARLVTSAAGYDSFNAGTYRGVIMRSALATPGLVIMCARLRHNRRDPLGLASIAVLAVFVAGWITRHDSYGRVFPGLILTLHIAMADWLADRLHARQRMKPDQRLVALASSLVVVAGIAGTATGWIRGVPRALLPAGVADDQRLRSQIEPYTRFGDLIDQGVTVAAPTDIALAVAGGGAKLIGAPVPTPFVDSNDLRVTDMAAIVDPTTTGAIRIALLAKYGCRWLVVRDVAADSMSRSLPGSTVVGTVDGYSVLELPIT